MLSLSAQKRAPGMDAEAVRQMLHEDRAEWEALVAVLDAHPDGAVHDPESTEWTARDVYTHLARWITHSTNDLKAVLAGGKIALLEGSDDEINARWQAGDSHLSLDQASQWARQAFERRIQAIEAVAPDRWDNVLESIARADGADHYRGHRQYIVVS